MRGVSYFPQFLSGARATREHSECSGGTKARSRGRTASSTALNHHRLCRAARAGALGACSTHRLAPIERAAAQVRVVHSINQTAVPVCSDKPSQLPDRFGLLSNSRLLPACGSSSFATWRAGRAAALRVFSLW